MSADATQQTVRKVEDEWIEVPAELADGSGIPIGPIQLRPGTADDEIRISSVPSLGADIKITDLRRGLDLLEEEARR